DHRPRRERLAWHGDGDDHYHGHPSMMRWFSRDEDGDGKPDRLRRAWHAPKGWVPFELDPDHRPDLGGLMRCPMTGAEMAELAASWRERMGHGQSAMAQDNAFAEIVAPGQEALTSAGVELQAALSFQAVPEPGTVALL